MPDPIARPLVDEPVLTGRDENSPVIIEAAPSGVVLLTLNRPQSRNAFGPDLVVALSDALDTLQGADHVRAVFLRGSGGVFSAGPDLAWLAETADWYEDDNREDALRLVATLKKLADLPQLTVALVEGEASGPGLGLVAACDMAVATETALFCLPEVKLGLTPAVVAPYLIRALGARTAKALIATGRSFGAAEAVTYGLVQVLTEDAAGFPALVAALSAEVRDCAPEAMREAKALVEDFADRPLDHGLMEESARRAARRRGSEEAHEGVKAAQEQRKPSWAD
jgi:methylglutaconyl-CoA hydratase